MLAEGGAERNGRAQRGVNLGKSVSAYAMFPTAGAQLAFSQTRPAETKSSLALIRSPGDLGEQSDLVRARATVGNQTAKAAVGPPRRSGSQHGQ
jgi:hypothetical protein